jgi:hypothetical protein
MELLSNRVNPVSRFSDLLNSIVFVTMIAPAHVGQLEKGEQAAFCSSFSCCEEFPISSSWHSSNSQHGVKLAVRLIRRTIRVRNFIRAKIRYSRFFIFLFIIDFFGCRFNYVDCHSILVIIILSAAIWALLF